MNYGQLEQLGVVICPSTAINSCLSLRRRSVVVVSVMEVDKMDENDWKYHGEGNKSLVVSHVQVSQARKLTPS